MTNPPFRTFVHLPGRTKQNNDNANSDIIDDAAIVAMNTNCFPETKDETVRKMRAPEMIVASIWAISLPIKTSSHLSSESGIKPRSHHAFYMTIGNLVRKNDGPEEVEQILSTTEPYKHYFLRKEMAGFS
jgi:hypothetical protein